MGKRYAQVCSVAGAAEIGGSGNHCVDLQGSSVCTYECTANSGCPDGYTCRETRSGNYLSTSVCVPNDYTCSTDSDDGNGGGSTETAGVRIQELLADPPTGMAGDVNGDGARDARGDEYVELTNTGDEAVDISGWALADSVTSRYRFPADTVLAPGETLVVFGGGEPGSFSGLPEGANVLASDGLYLNNRGDTVTVVDHTGDDIDRVEYGTNGGRDRALVRDGDQLSLAEGTGTPGE